MKMLEDVVVMPVKRALETSHVFNRPFRFMIRETSTGTILLMGRVAKL